MNRICLTTALLLAGSLAAQGTYYSPVNRNLMRTEGNSAANYIGGYANSRFQLLDENTRGKKMNITEVAFRLDHRNHNTSTASGRKWTNVKLRVASGDGSKFSRTFANNALNTLTQVFSAAVSFPGVLGTPIFKPTSFDKYAFPFNNSYAFDGAKDLLLDFLFAGGTMDNNATWTTSRLYSYYLDGVTVASQINATAKTIGLSNNCLDSGFTFNTTAYTTARATTYGDSHGTSTLRNKIKYDMWSYYTAKKGFILQAVGFPNTAGINIGAKCQKLYLNTALPFIPLGRQVNHSSGYSGIFTAFAPYNSAFNGIALMAQTAWDDSKTKQFALTRATQVTLPTTTPDIARRWAIYHYTPTSATGFGPNLNANWLWPVARIKHK